MVFSGSLDDGWPSQHGFDGSEIAEKVLSHRCFEDRVIEGGGEIHRFVTLFESFLRQNRHALTQLRGKGIRENGRSIRGQANQRSEPAERDGGEINEQMPLYRTIGYHLPDGSFPLRR